MPPALRHNIRCRRRMPTTLYQCFCPSLRLALQAVGVSDARPKDFRAESPCIFGPHRPLNSHGVERPSTFTGNWYALAGS
jgi:hypothetical protein